MVFGYLDMGYYCMLGKFPKIVNTMLLLFTTIILDSQMFVSAAYSAFPDQTASGLHCSLRPFYAVTCLQNF